MDDVVEYPKPEDPSPKITLRADVAAVILDLVESMNGPTTDEEMAFSFRRAWFLLPLIEEAFYDAEIDMDEVERPEIPKMVPGSGWKPQG